VFQNVNGLPDGPTDDKQQQLDEWLQREKVGIVLIAETKKYWPAVPKGRQWRDRMRSVSPSGSFVEAAHNIHEDRASTPGSTQSGGCAAAVLGKVAHFNPTSGQDPSGLGRWTWIRIRGRMIHQEELDDWEAEEGGEEGDGPARGTGIETVLAQQRHRKNKIRNETTRKHAELANLPA